MSRLLQDLRYAIRRSSASPGITILTIVVFALGIGINTATFSIVNAAPFRTLAVHAPNELVSIYRINAQSTRAHGIPYADYLDLHYQKGVFSSILAFTMRLEPVTLSEQTEVAVCELVSANYFAVLGVNLEFGRIFLADEGASGAHPIAVISYQFWEHHLNADPNIIGRVIKVAGCSLTVVGVMPRVFKGLIFPNVISAQLWIPLGMLHNLKMNQAASVNVEEVLAIGRLSPGITLRNAQAALEVKARQSAQNHPDTHSEYTYKLYPTKDIRIPPDPSSGGVPGIISIALLAISAAVLLIASSNIAGLLMARGIARKNEVGIRLAMGATRCQIIRQLLTETVLLSFIAGVFGLILASFLVHLGISNTPIQIEFVNVDLEIPIDLRVLLFTFLACFGSGALAGIPPAFRASKTNLVDALTAQGLLSGQKRPHVLRNCVLIPQVCLSLLLLLIASLFVKTLLKAEWLDEGFDTKHSATIGISLKWNNYDERKGRQFYQRLLRNARASPDIAVASLVNALPMSMPNGGTARRWIVSDHDLDAQKPLGHYAYFQCISPGYFQTLTIPILRGRDFHDRDDRSATPVVIVSEYAARLLWPGQDP